MFSLKAMFFVNKYFIHTIILIIQRRTFYITCLPQILIAQLKFHYLKIPSYIIWHMSDDYLL